MHKAYLGQHQFSIEGLDMTVPMLDELIQLAAAHGGKEVVIGMAHRGRLNVLAHNLGRPYDTIFAEFEGASTLEAVTTIPQGGTGDVKYHHGTQGSYQLPDGETIQVNLESNPSHLEYVSPVVEGATRAAQTTRKGPHAHQDTDAAVPIVIHGDASFPAQGVVAETLNLQALDGYKVGGTVHLITNNQIGFTTDPDDARSTRWASDLAKGFDVPIIHVNADDVPACMSAVRLAFAFRKEFGHDVLIDLIGYRRFGHNESDEPAYTQPEMYAKIKGHEARGGAVGRAAGRRRGRHPGGGRATSGRGCGTTSRLLHQRLKAKIAAAAEHGSAASGTGEYQLDRSPCPDVRHGRARRAPARTRRRSCCARPRASPCTRSSSNSSSAAARRWRSPGAPAKRAPEEAPMERRPAGAHRVREPARGSVLSAEPRRPPEHRAASTPASTGRTPRRSRSRRC